MQQLPPNLLSMANNKCYYTYMYDYNLDMQ